MDSGTQLFENSMSFRLNEAPCAGVGVIADLPGTVLSAQERDFIRQPQLAGLIFFARNYESPQQLARLTADIRTVRPDLLLCVDQEGGRVQRFREGFTRLPPVMALEGLWQQNRAAAEQMARDLGWLMAYEVRRQGVHLSFAPVLDIERGVSRVIGDRAFGHDATTVIQLASAFVAGMNAAGMSAVGKHFPGHGAIAADSHLALPLDPRPLAELEYDMSPFRALNDAGLLAGIMPAHVVYPAVDEQHTAGFSPLWLQQILRRQLGFNGVIFSDDLTMEGAASAGDYALRARAAMQAGANALVVCNNPAGAQQVIDAVCQQLQQPGWQALSLQYLQGPDVLSSLADEEQAEHIRTRLTMFS